MFKFLKSLFSSERDYTPNPDVTGEQKFALACGAVLGEMNANQHEWLHGDPPKDAVPNLIKATLEASWGVSGREDLLKTLSWLEQEGHRVEYEKIRELYVRKGQPQKDVSELMQGEDWVQGMTAEDTLEWRSHAEGMWEFWETHKSILGWDLGRANWLCRWGAAVGYITDDEAWEKILGYARQLRGAFGSWKELGENYRAGYNFWCDPEADDGDVVSALEELNDKEDPNSPWNLIPWK